SAARPPLRPRCRRRAEQGVGSEGRLPWRPPDRPDAATSGPHGHRRVSGKDRRKPVNRRWEAGEMPDLSRPVQTIGLIAPFVGFAPARLEWILMRPDPLAAVGGWPVGLAAVGVTSAGETLAATGPLDRALPLASVT